MGTEWIKYGKSWEQFCDDDLNVPGTEIDIRSGRFLIGNITECGKECSGGCQDFPHHDMVRQYRVLVTEE